MAITMSEFEVEVIDYAGEGAKLVDGRSVAFDYVVEAVPGGDDWTCPSSSTLERVALAEVRPEHMDHPHVIEHHSEDLGDGEILTYVTLSILDRNDS